MAGTSAEIVAGSMRSLEMSTRASQAVAPSKEMLQQFGMWIVYKNLTYSVRNSQNSKLMFTILKNVSGFLEPGQMTALMGPSGSGKTTLLDVLAGRKTVGQIEGEILFSGQKPSIMFQRRFTGYVEQFDTLIGTLSVKEMLLYTAELKRSEKESGTEKQRVVDDVIDKLALGVCKDTRIGSYLARGISGGQAKRTNIGLALVTNPKVMFLDEPTTGLDSYTSNDVMKVVRQLIADGTTICATIHSPTQFTFRLFDSVVMLVQGETVYFGKNGEPLVRYVQRLPGVEKLGNDENEAEWITDIFTGADRQGLGQEFADIYAVSDLEREVQAHIKEHEQENTNISKDTLDSLNVRRATTTSFFWGLWTWLRFRTKRSYQDPEFIGARLGDKTILALLIMTLYWGISDTPSEENLLNISSALVMWCVLPAFGAASYMPELVLERPLYVRERNDGLYRSITYLVAKMMDELLMIIVVSVVFACVVFFPLQLQGSFFVFWIVYFITLCNGVCVGYFVASLAPNLDVANAALPAYVTTLLFFAGFLFAFRFMPNYWIWYTYIDFIRYAWMALMNNQWVDQQGGDLQFVPGYNIVQYYEVDQFSVAANVALEGCFFVFFFLCTWTTLTYKKYASR